MTVSPEPSEPLPAHAGGRDHSYHPLTIHHVTVETNDAKSFALDIPGELAPSYSYEAGQFLTFKVTIDGTTVYRSYSMSSAPSTDDALAVTVKRVPGGAVSNWMIDTLDAGATVEVSVPAGVFCLTDSDRDIVTFAAGSGITPILSLIKATLATTSRKAHLLYANRDRDATIFANELDALVAANPDRLTTAHHLDIDGGFMTATSVEPLLDRARRADCYVCGPGPFMDLVEAALLAGGVPNDRIHIERFTVSEPVEALAPENSPPDADSIQVTIDLNGKVQTTKHHPGTTILQTARQMGMAPPFSCEAGNCATCMAKLIEGEVKMHNNTALYDDEVADGWILTCQSVPLTPTVHVVYGDEGN